MKHYKHLTQEQRYQISSLLKTTIFQSEISRIIGILKANESGAKVCDLCREHGMGRVTFYKWRSKFGGVDVSMIKQLKVEQLLSICTISLKIIALLVKGNSYDSALIENFWGILKNELVYHENYETRQQAIDDITKYIELDCNQPTKNPKRFRHEFAWAGTV